MYNEINITKSVINFITKCVNDKTNNKKLLKATFFSKKILPVPRFDTPYPLSLPRAPDQLPARAIIELVEVPSPQR
jgi:hypothetical protein